MTKNQSKIYIIIALFTLIVLMLLVFLIYPVLADIQNISEEILTDKNNVISINNQNVDFENFKKKYNNYINNLEKLDASFVDPKNPIDFIKFLEKTASDSGINTDIKMDITLSDKGFNNFPVAISNMYGTGNFLDILRFAEKLDASPYVMRIKNISIKKSPQKSTVDFNFSVEAVTK